MVAVAIPMLDEGENLPALFQRLERQSLRQFALYACVNQPEAWWDDGQPEHLAMCQRNLESLLLLQAYAQSSSFPLVVLDRSSRGKGWTGKKHGVGWARKVLFDTIAERYPDDCIMVSMDADTDFSDLYLEKVLLWHQAHPSSSALSVPYFHPLTGNEQVDRPLLRYECYMRHYLIQLLRIGNDYAFSALGSAMTFPLWDYRRVGGITPLQGGEDFYLMQKFVKTGSVGLDFDEVVRPSGRPSRRVPFGTGPAVAMDIALQQARYPFYPAAGFDAVGDTFALFPELYEHDLETPMSAFLRQQLSTEELWQPLRKNFKSRELFVHACKERVDGLRILQYLKAFPDAGADPVNFISAPLSELDAFRQSLFREEMSLRMRKK